MANATVSLLGTGTPFRLNDIGNGDLALATHSYVTGQPLGTNDRTLGLLGIDLPFRVFAIGDGGFALGVSAPVSAGASGDASIPLFGNGIPIRLISMGDKTYTIGAVSQPTGTARASNDVVFPMPGSNFPVRFIRQSKGDYALCLSSATSTPPSADAVAGLWGVNLRSRLVGMGDLTYALASADYSEKVLGIASSSLVALWPLNEASGTTAFDQSGNGRNAAYTNSPTLGQTGIGDGGTAPLFVPANNTFVNTFTASMAAAFNGSQGTFAMWFKVSGAGVWTDAASRYLFIIAADGNNQVRLTKTTTNNQLQWVYDASATLKSANVTYSATTWSHFAMTWDKAGDAFKFYLNGAQSGATVNGLGVWAGVPTAGNCGIASLGGAGSIWDGYCAMPGLWSTVLSATQISTLATVP